MAVQPSIKSIKGLARLLRCWYNACWNWAKAGRKFSSYSTDGAVPTNFQLTTNSSVRIVKSPVKKLHYFSVSKRKKWLDFRSALLIALGGVLFLTGCSNFVDRDQIAVAPDSAISMEHGHTIGQTFIARHGGLNGVEIHLSPEFSTQGTVVLHLRTSPSSSEDLLTATVSLPSASPDGFYCFSFPSILHSHNHYYYGFLEFSGTGRVEVSTGNLNSYLEGTLYYDHKPVESQSVFKLNYNPPLIIIDLLLMLGGWIGYGVIGIAILFLAGYWIIRKWTIEIHSDFTIVLTLSIACALSAWMVFLAWAALFQIHLSTITVRFLIGSAVLFGLVCFVNDRAQWRNKEYWLGKEPVITLAMWGIILCSIGFRLFVGRGLVMLPGVDAYHHTLIVQLFEEQGGIPHTYQPYAPLVSFSYHWGFHSIVALFRWLFGTGTLTTTKTMALIINGAIVATIAWLGEQITGTRRAGLIAAALVGLIMVSPFCLLRWSRFTQTAGMFFLPLALMALLGNGEKVSWQFSLFIAATIFSHLRIGLFCCLFAAILLVTRLLQHQWREIKHELLIGIAGTILALPTLLRIVWVQIDPYKLRINYPVLQGYNDILRLEKPILSFSTNWPVLILLLFLVGLSCWGKKGVMGRVFALWCLVLVGGALTLPLIGFEFWDLKTAVLSLPIPLAGLASLGTKQLLDLFQHRGRRVVSGGLIVLVLLGIITGCINFPAIVYTGDIYLRVSDLAAMEWINDNVSKNTIFLTNNLQFEWQPGWVVGDDAGYWLPLLTHRSSLLPPIVYTLEWADSSLSEHLKIIQQLTTNQESINSNLGEKLVNQGVTHIYTTIESPSLAPRVLSQDKCLRLQYEQDRVRVFEVGPCR